MEVFPQLSRDHVIADLRRTNDMNVTIQNAMSGKIPTAPKSAKSSKSANKGQPPVDYPRALGSYSGSRKWEA